MFDSHAHLQDARVDDAAGVWARAQGAGVRRVLLAGVDSVDWERQAALEHLPGVARSVGIHPQVVATLAPKEREAEVDRLAAALARRSSAVVALGEIGMDGVGERRESYDAQADLFATQLRLAQQHDLPVLLHVLRAHEEALKVLAAVGVPAAGGVVHSYSGSPELVPRYLELGLHLSFSGSITWHEGGRAARAVKACPPERLLVETDAPDQTPRARRPAPNEPAFLADVVRAVASIRGEPEREIAARTHDNACRLFRIEEP
ncbi:MAG: TatD family hydrolase [Labilithrix sp.]|nr:TatD family hydrolase [Labilithrix sp.]MCW5810980.1 TatD family hydrolase [Labilithrix sp.]